MLSLCGAHWSTRETALARDAFEAGGVSTAADQLVGFREGETVLLWEAETELFGRPLPSWLQSLGTCVGMGCGRAMQDSIYYALAFGDQVGSPVSVAWEIPYGVARTARDLGAGRMGSDPNGNYPAWFARAFYRYGVAVRRNYGAWDLTTQREELAATWAVRGVPQPLLDESAPWPAAACYWPETVDEVLGALRAGYGVARAAAYATQPRRDAQGYCGLMSSGGHCQAWRGVIVDLRGEVFVPEQQSWPGESAPHGTHEVTDRTGRPITLPEGCGLIDLDDVRRILREGEVIAFQAPRNLWRSP